MLRRCIFWPSQKPPAQNFEIVRCSFVNGSDGNRRSSRKTIARNQRCRGFQQDDRTQANYQRRSKCQTNLGTTRSKRELRKFAAPGDGFSPSEYCSFFSAWYA